MKKQASTPIQKTQILLIEDDPAVRGALRKTLTNNFFDVWEAGSGPDGLRLAKSRRPDLILLDWVLGSGPHGIDVCADLKALNETRSIPIIVMTGTKVEFEDELAALSNGADLYLPKDAVLGKPAKSHRFLKYIESLLARPHKLSPPPASYPFPSSIQIDIDNHTVRANNKTVSDLSTKLFDLLYVLARHYPNLVSRRRLLKEIWKNAVHDREVDVAICRLKGKIEEPKQLLIESVVHKGYRLKLQPAFTRKAKPRKNEK